jgi:hypothetical protein
MRVFLIILCCIVGALCAYWIWAYNHYQDHVPPGTLLAGEDVGGFTLDEARETGQRIYDSIVMDLKLVDDSGVASVPAITKTLTAEELGVRFDADATAQGALNAGSDGWFVTRVNPFSEKNVGLSVVVDDAAVTERVGAYFKDAVFESVLPKVKYKKKDKAFKVTPGVTGTVLDTERFLAEIKSGVFRAGQADYDIHLNPLPPGISDAAAEEAAATALKATKTKVSFVKDDEVAYKAPTNSKASWIVFNADEEGGKFEVDIDTDKVSKFLKTTASEVLVDEPLPELVVREIDMEAAEEEAARKAAEADKAAKEKAAKEKAANEKTQASAKATDSDAGDSGDSGDSGNSDDSDERGDSGSDGGSSDGSGSADTGVKEPAPKGARVVRPGEEGLAIANRKELAKKIKASMLAFENIKLTPEYETIPYETEEIGADFGKWIETDLSKQRTYLWNGNKKLKTYVVSTGKNATPTITGTYEIYMKREKHTMVGVDPKTGKEIYRTPDVPWISYFKGGYAYHGAYWHNAFGTQVSHGCINMRIAEAKELYEWAPVGTTCIIHY